MKKIFYLLSCFAFVFWGCNPEQENELLSDGEMGMQAEDETLEYTIDEYNGYPVDFGWFQSRAEMLSACQIPINTVKRMTTQALIQAILDHPLMIEVFWKYQYQRDWDDNIGGNACNELAKRNDAGKLLLERLDVTSINPLYYDYNNSFNIIAVDFLLSLNLRNLDEDNIKTIIEIALKKYNQRKENLEYNHPFMVHRHVTLILISKAMLAAGYTPFVNAVNENKDLKAYSEGNADYIYNPTGIYTEHWYSNFINFVEINIPLSNFITQLISDYAINFINEK